MVAANCFACWYCGAQEAETLSKKQAAQELAIRTLRTTTKKAEEDAAEAVTAKVGEKKRNTRD